MSNDENCCEIDIGRSCVDWTGELCIRSQRFVPLLRRHDGPRGVSRSRAKRLGSTKLSRTGSFHQDCASAVGRWRQVRRRQHGILDQRKDGTTDTGRPYDRVRNSGSKTMNVAQKTIGWTTAIIALGLAALGAIAPAEAQVGQARPSAVGVMEAVKRPITGSNDFIGRIESPNRVSCGTDSCH